jgi:hypothetical protein
MNQPLRKYRLASAKTPGSALRAQSQTVGTRGWATLPPLRLQEIQRGRAGIVARSPLNPSR